jgi:CspA family cold shock protein
MYVIAWGNFISNQKQKQRMQQTAVVKYWNYDKGWGFLAPELGGSDVFAHISETGGADLLTGRRVQYEMGTSPKTGKPCAVNVQTI